MGRELNPPKAVRADRAARGEGVLNEEGADQPTQGCQGC